MTGLSGSGKSTISKKLERVLVESKKFVYWLDGDNVRYGLNADLGFSDEARAENIRRVSEVAKLFSDSGAITIVSFISPFRESRKRARDIHQAVS